MKIYNEQELSKILDLPNLEEKLEEINSIDYPLSDAIIKQLAYRGNIEIAVDLSDQTTEFSKLNGPVSQDTYRRVLVKTRALCMWENGYKVNCNSLCSTEDFDTLSKAQKMK